MSEQPRQHFKFGTPEYKAFMAKRQAAASNTPANASTTESSDSDSGIAASIVAAIPPSTFQSVLATSPAPKPKLVTDRVVLKYVDDTVVQDTDWTPQSPELHGWSAEDIAQVKNIPRPKDIARLMNVGRVKDFVRPKDLGSKSLLAAAATFGIYMSDKPAFGFHETSSNAYYRVNRIYPSIDGTYRSNNGDIHPRPSWGCASKPSCKVIQWRKAPEPADKPPTEPRGTIVAHAQVNGPVQGAAQPAKSAVPSIADQRRVLVAQRQHDRPTEATQHPASSSHPMSDNRSVLVAQQQDTQPFQQGRQPHHHHHVRSASPYSPPGLACHPELPRVHHDPVHLCRPDSYHIFNVKELQDEINIRGLGNPANNSREDITDVLIKNDQDWREQLVRLEWEVLGRLWDDEAIDFFMETRPFRSHRYLNYGDLKAKLIDQYPATPMFMPGEQRRILLGIAYQDHVVLDPQMHVHYLDIAKKIADFRARKIATEQEPARRQACEFTRARLHGDVNRAAPGLQRNKRQRDKDLDEEFEDEAKPKSKKSRRETTSTPIEKVSAKVHSRAIAESTPEQSNTSEPANNGNAGIKKRQARGEKRPRETDDDEKLEPEPKHKKARRVTSRIKVASKTAKAGAVTEITAKQSTSSPKNEERRFAPKSKGTKRQRDEEDKNTNPETRGPSNATSGRSTRNSRRAGLLEEEDSDKGYVVVNDDDWIVPDDEDKPVRAKKKRRTSDEKEEGFDRAKFRRNTKLIRD